ncbi:mycofactocin precursor MftA [Streptomyces sp. NPDC054833]
MDEDQIHAEQETAVDDVVEEILVEEVSIDGMCGVY